MPLDLVGMDAEPPADWAKSATWRWPRLSRAVGFLQSDPLAVVEAMMVGLPIVGLATTEMSTVVGNGESGWVDTRIDMLVERMQALLAGPAEGRRLGDNARRDAIERFNIDRFAAEWSRLLLQVCA